MDAAAELAALSQMLPRATVVAARWAERRLASAQARLARGEAIDRVLAECRARLEPAVAEVERRGRLPLTIAYPDLPVAAAHDEILATIATAPAFVLTGETGSGKTTQLPKMLLEAGRGRRGLIAVTQPRRVAAVAIAERLRDECRAPEPVIAHSVRFDDHASDDTLVRVLTDGLLLAEASRDPDLTRYDAIVVDEAHERSLNIDLLLALLKRLRQRRPDLVVAVSSASIEAERFAAYLGADAPAPIVAVGGRAFPVEVRWRDLGDEDIGYLGATVDAIREIHAAREPGDVLAFLPTERDILDAARRLHDLAGASVLPLFSRLTPREQRRVFAPARGRKIVLATNIAETSLTIPGVVFVIDAGLARVKRWHAASRTERLPVEPVAQASCVQRAGRAGRIQPGVCIRLYAQDDFAKRAPFTDPEILRANLAGVVVQCLALGLGDAERLPWLDQPAPQAWRLARGLLDELGAICEDDEPDTSEARRAPRAAEDGGGGHHGAAERPTTDSPRRPSADLRVSAVEQRSLRLTGMGRELAAIPTDPSIARMLVAGVVEGVPHEACTIAAFLSVQDPRVRPLGCEAKADAAHRGFAHEAGDLATILNLWDAWNAAASGGAKARLCESSWLGLRRMREWADVRHQLWSALRDRRAQQLPPRGHAAGEWPLERVHRAVLAGRLGNVLMYDKTERCYRGSGDRKLVVHPGSALRGGKDGGDGPANKSKAAARGDARTSGSTAGERRDGRKSAAPPPWLVACEVVETSRLFARLCAPIDPEWVVALVGARAKIAHRDAQWHARRRQVVCVETIRWRGLPVRDGRLVPYERIDPVDATRVLIREALVGDAGDQLEREFPLIADNRALVRRARGLRERLRDPDLWIDDAALEAFYRERLGVADAAVAAPPSPGGAAVPAAGERNQSPRSSTFVPGSPQVPLAGGRDGRSPTDPPTAQHLAVASTDALRRWLGAHGEDRLRLGLADLVDGDVLARADRDFPEQVDIGGATLPLRWRFAPGDADDGATLAIREDRLDRLTPERLDWLVPGFVAESVEHLLRALPKEARKRLHPVAESAARLAQSVRRHAGALDLPQALAAELRDELGAIAPPDAGAIPDRLRLRVEVVSLEGKVIHAGRDRAFLAGQLGGSERIASLRAANATGPSRAWPALDGALPRPLDDARGPWLALGRCRDRDGSLAAEATVYAGEASARAWHDDGLDALIEASLADELERLASAPAAPATAAVVERALGARLGALRRACAVGQLVAQPRAVVDPAAFAAWRARALAALPQPAALDAWLVRVAERADAVRAKLKQGTRSLGAAATLRSAGATAARLTAPGWAARYAWPAAQRLDAWLDACIRRLDQAHAAEAPRVTARGDELIGEWEHALAADAARWAAPLGLAKRLREAAADLEDALAAFSTPGATSGSAFAVQRARASFTEIATAIGRERNAVAATRERLLRARETVGRIGDATLRDRLARALDERLKAFPELGWGVDLAGQRRGCLALAERVEAAAGAASR